jgi:hypothetical protein
MTAVRLVDIIEGLESQLRSIDGLRVFDHVPGAADYPAALILPPDIDYRRAMAKGFVRLELEVVVLVSAVVDRMQRDLFEYLDWTGPKSIVAAVDNDKTLGIPGINAVAMSCRQLGLEEIAGYNAWGGAVRFLIGSTAS